jgi:KaiC/GvpD/RAD55 family RecA-like ATPase
LLPPRSVDILVGDSGVGKTPLVYQLALAVASGKPFLGLPTRVSNVLLVDYENAPWDSQRILEQQLKHLGLAAYPSTFLLWPLSLGSSWVRVEHAIREMGPELVILDSLRSYNPAMESDNKTAAKQINRLRETACRLDATVLLVHHIRKQRTRLNSDLEEGDALDWMFRTAGARALINQTDVRLAVARRKAGAEPALVLRGQYRTTGEIGPLFLRRRLDADGEPLGFERVQVAASTLENLEQEAAYHRLPEAFHFKDARMLSGKHDDGTNRFLHKLMNVGLIYKTGRGEYRKSKSAPEAGVSE